MGHTQPTGWEDKSPMTCHLMPTSATQEENIPPLTVCTEHTEDRSIQEKNINIWRGDKTNNIKITIWSKMEKKRLEIQDKDKWRIAAWSINLQHFWKLLSGRKCLNWKYLFYLYLHDWTQQTWTSQMINSSGNMTGDTHQGIPMISSYAEKKNSTVAALQPSSFLVPVAMVKIL